MTAYKSLKSTGICKLLIRLFRISLGFTISSSLFSLIEVLLPSVYQNIVLIDALQAIVGFLVHLTSFVVFMIWMYRIHVDLKIFFTDYPITPGGSLARYLIPFYNIWGIWNTLSTFAERFSKESGDIKELSDNLKKLIPLLYALSFISNALNRLLLKQALSGDGQMNPILLLITCPIDIGLTIAFLELAKTMGSTITKKAKREIA